MSNTAADRHQQWLQDIASRLGKNARKVARRLCVTDEDIENIDSTHKDNSEEAAYQMLRKWHQNYRGNNPIDTLYEALVDCELKGIADTYLLRRVHGVIHRKRCNIAKTVGNFVTTEDMNKCKKHLENENSIVLTGLSGSGKTEIAKRYWEDNRQKYECGWFIHSETEENIRNALAKCSRRFQHVDPDVTLLLEDICEEMKRESDRKFFIIFDDVSSATQKIIQKHFDTRLADNITVIITTQTVQHGNENSLKIEGFSQEEMLELLRELETETLSSKVKLWNEMGRLPCALVCAVYDINKQKTTIEQYLKAVNDVDTNPMIEQRTLNALGSDYNTRGFVKAHVQSVKSMMKEIEEEFNEDKVHVARGLCLVFKSMAYMNSNAIPVFFLVNLLSMILDQPTPLPEEKLEQYINQLIDKMQNRWFVTIFKEDSDRYLDSHDLVKLATRMQVDVDSRNEPLEKLFKALLSCFAKDTGFMAYFKTNAALLPHVEEALDRVEQLRHDDPTKMQRPYLTLMEIGLSDVLGNVYAKTEREEQSEKKLERAVDLFFRLIDANDKCLQSGSDFEAIAQDFYQKLQKLVTQNEDVNVLSNFVVGLVLNKTDVEQLRRIAGDIKFPERGSQFLVDVDTYHTLVEHGVALPEKQLKRMYLPELFASVLHEYGRLYLKNAEKYENIKDIKRIKKFKSAIKLSHAICQVITENTKVHVLHTILTKRNALLHGYSEDADDDGKAKLPEHRLIDLYKGKEKYEELLKEAVDKTWFQHGIMKLGKDDPHHSCKCRRKLLYICMKLLNLEVDQLKLEEIESYGIECVDRLKKDMASQEETMMLERGADYLFVCAEFNLARHAFKDAIDDYRDAIQRYKNSAIPTWKKYFKAVKGMINATHCWKETCKPEDPEDVSKAVQLAKEEAEKFKLSSPNNYDDSINKCLKDFGMNLN
ncbi:unnamed protein product [Owenia fusiformis]|uniref:Death domain-containing protein n=1 Tax=Owenia fusiformis TaxID=6347 RepID=A0A8S4Q8J7_OWEFU|nr:unnamed protein product [Owenia fusiformis]